MPFTFSEIIRDGDPVVKPVQEQTDPFAPTGTPEDIEARRAFSDTLEQARQFNSRNDSATPTTPQVAGTVSARLAIGWRAVPDQVTKAKEEVANPSVRELPDYKRFGAIRAPTFYERLEAKAPIFTDVRAFTTGIKTLAKGLPLVASTTAASLSQAIRNGDINRVKTARDDFIDSALKDASDFAEANSSGRNFLPGISIRTAGEAPLNWGYTLSTLATSLVVGLPAAVFGTPFVGVPAGAATGGVTAYRAAKDSIVRDMIIFYDKQSIKKKGRPLNESEIQILKDIYGENHVKFGLAEALFETGGQLVDLGILLVNPVAGAAAKSGVGDIIMRGALRMLGVLATENITETFTTQVQSAAEAAIGLRPRELNLEESFKAQFESTTLLTLVTLGVGGGSVVAFQKITKAGQKAKIDSSFKKEQTRIQNTVDDLQERQKQFDELDAQKKFLLDEVEARGQINLEEAFKPKVQEESEVVGSDLNQKAVSQKPIVVPTKEELNIDKEQADFETSRQGQLNKLDEDLKISEKEIDVLEDKRTEALGEGKPVKAIENKIDSILSKQIELDTARLDLLGVSDRSPVKQFGGKALLPVKKVQILEKKIVDEKFKALKKGLKEGGRRAIRETKSVQSFFTEIVKRSGLTDTQKKRFLQTLKNTNTVDKLDKRLPILKQQFKELQQANLKRTAIKVIKSQLKNVASLGSKKSGVKLSAEAKKSLIEVSDGLALTGKKETEQDIANAITRFVFENPGKPLPNKFSKRISNLGRTSIQSQSLQQLVDLISQIETIKETGRTQFEITTEQKETAFQKDKKKLADSLVSNSLNKVDISVRSALDTREMALNKEGLFKKAFFAAPRFLRAFDRRMRMPRFTGLIFDGGKISGVFTELITNTLDKAVTAKEVALDKVNKSLREILSPLGKNSGVILSQKFEVVDDSNGSVRTFSMSDLWGVYANTGNANNRATLTESWGYGMNEQFLQKILDLVPTEQKTMVDRIKSEILEELYSDTTRVSKNVYNFIAERVESYWPIVSDRLFNDKALIREQTKDAMGHVVRNLSMSISALNNRVGHSGIPKLNFFEVLTSHVQSVVHFNTHAEAVTSVQKLLFDKDIKNIMTQVAGPETHQNLLETLKDTANPVRDPISHEEQTVKLIRQGTTISILAGNISVVAIQAGSYTQTINRLRHFKGGTRASARAVKNFIAHPTDTTALVFRLSDKVRNRSFSFDREFGSVATGSGILRGIKLNRNLSPEGIKAFRKQLSELYMSPIKMVDTMTVVTTWAAAYDTALQNDMVDPISFADETMSLTQPTSRVNEVARILTGGEYKKLFTQFMTFMSTAYNNLGLAGHNLRRGIREGHIIVSLFEFSKSYFWLAMVPPLAQIMIKKPKDLDDPEVLAEALLGFPLGVVPYVRDVANKALHPEYGPGVAPVIDLLAQDIPRLITGRGAFDLGSEVSDDRKRLNRTKALNNLLGAATPYPSTAAMRVVQGVDDLASGRESNPMVLALRGWTSDDGNDSNFKSIPGATL